LKKNRNRVKPTGFGSVRFGFLGQKSFQTGLARFFRFWLGFLGFGSVFSGFGSVFFGLARFFWFGSVFPIWLSFGSVWLDFFLVFFGFGSVLFFWFFVYKTETEPAGFLKNLIGFFSIRFFWLFFFWFSRFNRFSSFFAHP